MGVEFDFDRYVFAATEHAEAAFQICLGVPIWRRIEMAPSAGKLDDASCVEVAVVLFADVPAYGVPLPDPVMDHQHVHFALGAFVVARREVFDVQRLTARR